MPDGDRAGATRRAPVRCSCGELGWPKSQARVERGRFARKLRRRPGLGRAVLARKCDKDDSGLVHVRIVPADGPPPTVPSLILELPARPYELVPGTASLPMVAYRVAVTAVLVEAIEQQGAGRLVPGARAIAKHFGVHWCDARDVRAELLAQQVIRRDAERYVTQARPTPTSTGSEARQ
jgi:hypothetical protein